MNGGRSTRGRHFIHGRFLGFWQCFAFVSGSVLRKKPERRLRHIGPVVVTGVEVLDVKRWRGARTVGANACTTGERTMRSYLFVAALVLLASSAGAATLTENFDE